MLLTRLAIGIPLTLAFLAILALDTFLEPWFPLWLLAMLVALGLGAREIVGLFNATSARPSGNTVLGGVLALIFANWIPHVLPWQRDAISYNPSAALDILAWPLLAFVAVVMLSFIVQSAQFHQPGRTMATIAGTVLAVAYIGLLGSFLIQFRWLDGPYRGLIPLTALLATAKGSDTGAYAFGRIAGKHKLWPRLSPNKTLEGAAGGLFVGVLGAVAVFGLARVFLDYHMLGWPAIFGFGLLVGASAQLGDLMESMIKRDCAQKDASDTLPGFGGVLDVLDSLLFAAPVAYVYWFLMVP